MQANDAARFDPPAPLAIVTVRSEQQGIVIQDVPMLLDTGSDVSLLPRSRVTALITPGAEECEIQSFDGTISTAPVINAEIVFLAKSFRLAIFITLPLMMPTVIVAILLRGIDALKTFDILYATKGKGGGSFHEVETLNVYAYGLSFDYNQYGLSSAVLILFFMIIIGSMWLLTMRKKAVSK